MPDRLTLQPGEVRLRHVYRPDLFDPPRSSTGAIHVLGRDYVASWEGVNGTRGFSSGNYERRLGEEGTFSVTFPNAAGEDGEMHRDRFLILTTGRRVVGGSFYTYTGGSYRPGDEWFEVYWASQGSTGNLLAVCTPTQATVTSSSISLTGYDAFWLSKKSRERATGFWHHSPNDVIRFYAGVWNPVLVEDFNTLAISNATGSDVNTSDGRMDTRRADTTAPELQGLSIVRLGPVEGTGGLARVRTSAARAITWGDDQ